MIEKSISQICGIVVVDRKYNIKTGEREMSNIDRNNRGIHFKLTLGNFLKDLNMSFVKMMFHYVLNQCLVFKNQIVYLFFRIRYFSAWSDDTRDIESYRRRLEVLVKKKYCVENIVCNKPATLTLLQKFIVFVRKKDEKELKIFYDSYKTIHAYKVALCEKKKSGKFLNNNTITEKDKEFMSERKLLVDQVKSFKNKMRNVVIAAEARSALQKKIIMSKCQFQPEEWNSMNQKLEKVKQEAQDHYDKHLREVASCALRTSIDYNIFNQETEFQQALIDLLNVELQNFGRIRYGKKSSLNFIARSYDLNDDNDISEWIEHSEDINNMLIAEKEKEIDKETAIAEERLEEAYNRLRTMQN